MLQMYIPGVGIGKLVQ